MQVKNNNIGMKKQGKTEIFTNIPKRFHVHGENYLIE